MSRSYSIEYINERIAFLNSEIELLKRKIELWEARKTIKNEPFDARVKIEKYLLMNEGREEEGKFPRWEK